MPGDAGPVLRFEPVAPRGRTAAAGDDSRIAVLDTTWTPTAEEVAAGRLISIRDVAAPILATVDLLNEATRLLDAWVGATTVVDDMTIDGTSLWFYVRLHDHGWLQQRILWLLVVDSIVRSVRPSRIEVASGADPVLDEVARLVAARVGIAFQAAPADPGLSRVGFGLELPAPKRAEPVKLGATVVVRRAPRGQQPASHFQAMQGRIQRALFDLQHVIRRTLDELRDAVAVQRSAAERLEDQHVERAGQEIAHWCLGSHN